MGEASDNHYKNGNGDSGSGVEARIYDCLFDRGYVSSYKSDRLRALNSVGVEGVVSALGEEFGTTISPENVRILFADAGEGVEIGGLVDYFTVLVSDDEDVEQRIL